MRLLGVLTLVALPSLAKANCASEQWAALLATGPQTPTLLAELTTESGRNVYHFELGTLEGEPLVGENAKRWLYIVFSDGDVPCIEEVVSLGSYAATASTVTDGGPRLYHLDHYRQLDHATLGMMRGELDREAITEAALKALN